MMRDLAISYGNSRQAKKWVNKTIFFDALKERLKTTIRTTESAEEYAKMSKAQRDAAKDHGGFVGGTLKGGRRKINTVELRSIITLDGDRIDKAFLDNYETNAPYTSVLYTTHSSTEDSPRVRIIFPMTRDVSSEEFVAVSRYVAQALGIDFFDECSYQPNQLMYWPSTPQNGVFVYKETDKEWLDPDVILSAHPEWTDHTQLLTSSRESKANTVTQQKVQDPLTKKGVVGLFNRVFFPVTKALETFLSDVYEPTDNPNRWHETNIRQILTNEKYIGDALLQKTYTVSILDKKHAANNGEMPKYYVEGSHEAIIDRDVFMKVKAEIARRANLNPDGKRRVYSSKYALSGMVFCGHRGDIYRRVKWNNRGCRSTVWRCVSRVLKGKMDFDCPARTVKEEVLQGAIVTAVNDAYARRNAVISLLKTNIQETVFDDLEARIAAIDEQLADLQQQMIDNSGDRELVEELELQMDDFRGDRQDILAEAAERTDLQARMNDMIAFLEKMPAAVTEYSEFLARRLVERITIFDEKIVVELKSGLQMEVEE